MMRKIINISLLLISFSSIGGSPGGLTTVIIPFESAARFRNDVIDYFDMNLSGDKTMTCADSSTGGFLKVGNYFVNKTLDESIIKNALKDSSSLHLLQERLANYHSSDASHGMDALLTYEQIGEDIIFYGISSDINETVRKNKISSSDIQNKNILGNVICKVLSSLPVHYEQ